MAKSSEGAQIQNMNRLSLIPAPISGLTTIQPEQPIEIQPTHVEFRRHDSEPGKGYFHREARVVAPAIDDDQMKVPVHYARK